MKIESFNEDLNFNNNKIVTKIIVESSFSKETRILMKEGQLMKEHKAPFPIIVHVLDGKINFGVEENILLLKKGDVITLTANVPHDLTALKESIIRQTLSKIDKPDRVEKVALNS